LQIKTKIVSCHTADSKPVKQEVNGIVILLPLVFPGLNQGADGNGEKSIEIRLECRCLQKYFLI
jgi:hypothetical protein